MRILYITQYFPPEIGAGALRALNISRCLTELGHSVQIICEIPNYPDGKIPTKYRKRLFYSEKYKGISIFRTLVCASNRNTFIKKVLFYISFMLSSVIGAFQCIKADIVIATSPPLTVAISGYVVSKLRGSKLILDIRDI